MRSFPLQGGENALLNKAIKDADIRVTFFSNFLSVLDAAIFLRKPKLLLTIAVVLVEDYAFNVSMHLPLYTQKLLVRSYRHLLKVLDQCRSTTIKSKPLRISNPYVYSDD